MATSDAAGEPRVVSLHRFPVKSMLGERVRELSIDERGVAADRRWSVRTGQGKIGSGKTTRRFAAVPDLQQLRARLTHGGVDVTFSDGTRYDVESPALQERLSTLVGQPVTLMGESGVSHFDDGAVSLIPRASVRALSRRRGERIDEARFRSNIVLDGVAAFADELWIGRRLRIGTAVLLAQLVSPRCVMVDQATADLPRQPGNLLALGRLNHARLGVVACVVQPGVIRVGDRVHVE